ncbi:MAG: Ig-like domain-containing protein, partial [Tumebacillaceae bacterium]
MSTNNWKANTSYWTTSAFSTAGYQNVTVTSYQAGSSTGPRDWSLQYSLDNTTWTTVNVNSNAMYQVGLANSTSVNWTPGTVNVKLPADAADKPTVYVRWLNTTTNPVGTGTVGSTGTDRISDISITGTPLSADPVSATGVTLDKTSLDLTAGGTGKLTASVQPANATNQAVSWLSSDTTVATVATDGTVTAVGAGTATITVTTADGNFQAIATVNVTAAPVGGTTVTGVTLNKSALALTVGATGQLTSTVQPDTATNKSVTWTTDNQTVATVDATGKVTAVAAGTANITVTTADGGFTSSATVTVTTAIAHSQGDVVISQVYANGGNSGAFYNQKFVELYNTTGQDINLSGWSIGYTSAASMDTT